jgi:hypothetical protein
MTNKLQYLLQHSARRESLIFQAPLRIRTQEDQVQQHGNWAHLGQHP